MEKTTKLEGDFRLNTFTCNNRCLLTNEIYLATYRY
jgi:hypothetical protein